MNISARFVPSRVWLKVLVGPALSGWLFALGFAPMAFRPFTFFALMLLMLSLKGLSIAEARRAGFIFGAVAYGVGLSWFWNLFGLFSLALIGLLSLYVMVFAWCQAVVQQQTWPAVLKVIVSACLWTGIEFARSELLPLNFPWMTIGHALDTTNTSELLSYVGVYGVGFIVMLLVSAIQQGREAWPVLVALLGLALIPSNDTKPIPTMTVAAIQSESSDFDHFVEKTKSLTSHPAIVVWPEQSVPFDVWASEPHRQQLLDLAGKGHVLVLGTQEKGPGREWSNIALTVTGAGKQGTHAKQHTVHFFNDGTPGTTAVPVKLPQGRWARRFAMTAIIKT